MYVGLLNLILRLVHHSFSRCLLRLPETLVCILNHVQEHCSPTSCGKDALRQMGSLQILALRRKSLFSGFGIRQRWRIRAMFSVSQRWKVPSKYANMSRLAAIHIKRDGGCAPRLEPLDMGAASAILSRSGNLGHEGPSAEGIVR